MAEVVEGGVYRALQERSMRQSGRLTELWAFVPVALVYARESRGAGNYWIEWYELGQEGIKRGLLQTQRRMSSWDLLELTDPYEWNLAVLTDRWAPEMTRKGA